MLNISLASLLALALLSFANCSQPMPTDTTANDPKLAHAYIGGGCFWCIEAVFETVDGVRAVVSGYAGGSGKANYHNLDSTGHAEVVRIDFDPAVVSYEQLLDLFWAAHDPTTMNRQGADHGTQYRSIILYADDRQKAAAERSRDVAQAGFHDPIVTQIVPLGEFYVAEDYHQDYFAKNPDNRYCTFVIKPKLRKLGR